MQTIQLLLEFGADSDKLDSTGKTYLQVLAEGKLDTADVPSEKDVTQQPENDFRGADDSISEAIQDLVGVKAEDLSLAASRPHSEASTRCGICKSVDLAFQLRRGILLCQRCSKKDS